MNKGINSSRMMEFMSNSKIKWKYFITTDCEKTEQGMMFMLWTESKILANHNVTTHFGQISIMLNKKHFTQTSLNSQWQILMRTLY